MRSKPTSPTLTPEMANDIRRLASTGTLAQHQIAALLGINQGRVSEVLSGKRFPELTS